MLRRVRRVGTTILGVVLPRIDAQAACAETWTEYTSAYYCCGTCGRACKKYRYCQWCNGVVSCGSWRCSTSQCRAQSCPC